MAEAATGNISVAKTRRILKLKKTPALGLNISPGPPPAPGPAAPAPAAPAPAAPAPAAPPPSFLPGVQPVAAALPPVAEYSPSAGSVKLFVPSEPYLPAPEEAPVLAPLAQQAPLAQEAPILAPLAQEAPILAPLAQQEEADNDNDDEELPAGENVRPNKPVIKMERDCNELFDQIMCLMLD